MERLGYIAFRILIFIFRIIPFWLLYILSDFLFFMFFYIIKYRKKVVFANLKNSFPEKSEEQIYKIAKGFYHNLSDITVESIKGLTVNNKLFLKRYKVLNSDLEKEIFKNGRGVIAVAAHYANWEWGAFCLSKQFSHQLYGFYKPLSNKLTDKYIRKLRAAGGMKLVSISETFQHFQKTFQKPAMHIMVSDQSPSNLKKAHWINFLNQDTPCLHGAEAYAKQKNLPVVYIDAQRVKRGFYELTLKLLVENPSETKDGEITKLFHEHLESVILRKPEDWLWSHNRWKHKRK